VGFALFLLSIVLFIGVLLLFFNGSPQWFLYPLLSAVGAAAVSLAIMFLGDLLPLVLSISVCLRGIHEQLAEIAARSDLPRD
jgi:ABC-type proline/glycine betaine transport system permease subunit